METISMEFVFDFDRMTQETFGLVYKDDEMSFENVEDKRFLNNTLEVNATSEQPILAKPIIESNTLVDAECVTDEEEVAVVFQSGVAFYLDLGSATFSLRGMAVVDCDEFARMLYADGDFRTHFLAKIKANEDFRIDDLRFFETDSAEEAQIIVDNLFNRRFPYFEDVLYNISDPGISWWCKDLGNRLEIYFKSHSVDREQELTKLGPIGDSLVATKIFNRMSSQICQLLELTEFYSDDRGLFIETQNDNEAFQQLKNIFLSGNWDPTYIQKLNPTNFYFLKEMSVLRKYWVSIMSEIKVAKPELFS